jgi:hypothetical protein
MEQRQGDRFSVASSMIPQYPMKEFPSHPSLFFDFGPRCVTESLKREVIDYTCYQRSQPRRAFALVGRKQAIEVVHY